MDLQTLKSLIETEMLSEEFFIFKWEDNTFLVNQYIEAISKCTKKEVQYVSSIYDVNNAVDDFFGMPSDSLYVVNVDNFDVAELDPANYKNCIVKCKNYNKDLEKTLGGYIIKFPKLLAWQVNDYVKMRLPGVDKVALDWLCDVAKNDISRLSLECDKIALFNKGEQDSIFNLINSENGYDDLCPLDIFNFSNAIMSKDLKVIQKVLHDLDNIDVEPVGLVTILYKNFKNLLFVQLNPNAAPEKLGMTSKQMYAIKRNINVYSSAKLLSIFQMLASIDRRLKSGEMPNNMIIDYVLTNILS